MSTYRIKSGDTLSRIALNHGTSVSALMKANPSIRNANMISAGASIQLPGSKDSFSPPKSSTGASYTVRSGDSLGAIAARFGTSVSAIASRNGIRNANLIYPGQKLSIPGKSGGTTTPTPPTNTTPTPPSTTSSGSASKAYDIARSELGKNAGSLKLENSAVGKAMEDWVPNNVNCASFVSGCLQAAGQISHSDYSAGCTTLMSNLDRNSHFKRTTLANAKPGDVVTFKTPGSHHTVMFSGYENGKPMFIGSNNINSDGSQRISIRNMNYQVLSVHHYVG